MLSKSSVVTRHSVAEDQYHEIISAVDAWLVVDDDGDGDLTDGPESKSTSSARRIKQLVEQITGRPFHCQAWFCLRNS
jgi:hypothetical protein